MIKLLIKLFLNMNNNYLSSGKRRVSVFSFINES